MTFSGEWRPRAIKTFDALPTWLQARTSKAALLLLAAPDPARAPSVRALRGPFRGAYRLRIGDWRLVFDVDYATRTVIVLRLGHRRDVYE